MCRKVLWLAFAAAGTVAMVPTLSAAAATSFPNDPFFKYQWALSGSPASINAPPAWCVSTGRGITVADVDTGVDFGHPDLAGKLITGGRFTNGSSYPSAPAGPVNDDNGHGTMTTGIMAADTNDGIGIAGVAPDARVLVVKVLDQNGKGYDSDVASGIRWAADNGAMVINVSIGPDVGLLATLGGSNIPDAVNHAEGVGAAVILAAGNSTLGYYQQFTGNAYLVVGALNPDASVASYSNSGQIYAPGGTGTSDPNQQLSQNIVSTYPANGGYYAAAGTSFATPQVSGVIAMLMSTGLSNAGAVNRVLNSANRSRGQPNLDAAAALGASGTCGGAPPPPPPPPPPPAHTAPLPAPHQPPPAAAPPGTSSASPQTSSSTSQPTSSPGPVAQAGVIPSSESTSSTRAVHPTDVSAVGATTTSHRDRWGFQVVAALAGTLCAVGAGTLVARRRRRRGSIIR